MQFLIKRLRFLSIVKIYFFFFFILLFFRSVSFKTTTGIVRRITDFVYFFIYEYLLFMFSYVEHCVSLMV